MIFHPPNPYSDQAKLPAEGSFAGGGFKPNEGPEIDFTCIMEKYRNVESFTCNLSYS